MQRVGEFYADPDGRTSITELGPICFVDCVAGHWPSVPAMFLDRLEGYWLFYRLVPSQEREASELFAYLLESFAKDKQLKADMKKLREAIKDGPCTVSEWKPLSGLASPKAQLE